MSLKFTLEQEDGKARTGRLETAHGSILTPVFMPVGTAGTVKAMTNDMLLEAGAQIILGNTYHLMLRPGSERVGSLGGLHQFTGWRKPILTDSGGFQVMSLSERRKISEKSVVFQSHIDGSRHELTPERSVEIQYQLDANITMQLDECVKLPAPAEDIKKAMELSLRWAERSKNAFKEREGYGIFGIVQGGTDPELRHQSAAGLIATGFDGYAIGGLAVGESQEDMFSTIKTTNEILPKDRPRYLMGVGTPSDLVGAVARGIDMFDCVMPTRSGRTGQAFTRFGAINLKNARHKDDPRPLDPQSTCPAANSYSRAYLHHLVKSNEILASILLTQNNLWFYLDLMAQMRSAIQSGSFAVFQTRFEEDQAKGDIAPL